MSNKVLNSHIADLFMQMNGVVRHAHNDEVTTKEAKKSVRELALHMVQFIRFIEKSSTENENVKMVASHTIDDMLALLSDYMYLSSYVAGKVRELKDAEDLTLDEVREELAEIADEFSHANDEAEIIEYKAHEALKTLADGFLTYETNTEDIDISF